MSNTEGFRPIFQAAKDFATDDLEQHIKHFRDSPIYHFIVAVNDQRSAPDYEALGIGVINNPKVVATCLGKSKSNLGYANPRNFCPVDMVDSRHIMMIAILLRWLPQTPDIKVVEIGGGFGNWVRLCEGLLDYRKWTIIDMPFVAKVQQWYLPLVMQDFSKIDIVDTDAYSDRWKPDQRFDLAIGAHSMSEFAMVDFDDYFENVVLKSQYFFYATHLSSPDPGMVRQKLDKINRHFTYVASVLSEQNAVGNFLFSRKNGHHVSLF